MILYLAILAVGFIIGALSFMKAPCDEDCKKTLKKHKDILNWLKSTLKDVKQPKLNKRVDSNKVRVLELIIKRLEK